MKGVSGLLRTLSTCAQQHLFLPTRISPGILKLHTNACRSGLGAVLYQTHDDGMDAVIAYASGSLTKAKSHYPAHKLEFLTLKWAVVKKYYEYLYGMSFNIYTDNNPLTYVLTTAKLDTVSHWWVTSLANYNFQLYYRTEKTNLNADALSRVSWPGCMPDTLHTHLQVTAVAVWVMQEATIQGPMSPIEVYSSYLCVLDSVEDSLQVACMAIDDWCKAQWTDLVLWLVIVRLQDRTLGQCQLKLSGPPELCSTFGNATTSHWGGVFCIRKPCPRKLKRPHSSWSCQLCIGRPPWRDAMMRLATWVYNRC